MNEMDERFLWQMIELAWKKAERAYAERASRSEGHAESLRQTIVAGGARDYDADLRPFCSALGDVLARTVTRDGFLIFVRAFETQLFALDREDLATHIALGDDGFLDARGFIVAMGEDYYRDVMRNPKVALVGVGVEQAYVVVLRAYETRFREPIPRSGIRVTTCSNLDGWPSRRKVVDLAARVERVREELLALLIAGASSSKRAPVVVTLDPDQRAVLEGILRASRPRGHSSATRKRE